MKKPLLYISYENLTRICDTKIKLECQHIPIGKVAISTKVNKKSHIYHGEIIKELWPTLDGFIYEYFLLL